MIDEIKMQDRKMLDNYNFCVRSINSMTDWRHIHSTENLINLFCLTRSNDAMKEDLIIKLRQKEKTL